MKEATKPKADDDDDAVRMRMRMWQKCVEYFAHFARRRRLWQQTKRGQFMRRRDNAAGCPNQGKGKDAAQWGAACEYVV